MKERVFDARRLDVAAFGQAAGSLQGELRLADLPRLCEGAVADQLGAAVPVSWQAEGEARGVAGGGTEWFLRLRARAQVPLECQRCLSPVVETLEIDRRFVFARDEEAAARLDEQSEDDVLVLTRALDLQELLEDELILALPLVPRHERCPQPLPLPADEPEDAEEPRPNPFAALAALRRKDPPG